jgi:hypothetical protein
MRHNGIRFHNHFRGDHWLRNAGWLAIYRPDLPMRATYGIGGAGHHRVVRGGRVSIGRRASGFVELKMINTVLWLILMAEDWRSKKIGQEWMHFCGKCRS